MAAYQTLIVEAPERAPGVALIRLNRPEALNALNTALLAELAEALAAAEADDQVGCIVLTGSAKAFAAGIGGTQRLTRFVGKSKAMDMILTGRMMDAAEAERSGLVSRVFPADGLIDEVLAIAAKIAAQSRLAVAMNKELVQAAYETTLTTGVALERRLFHSLFAFDDQKEGMAAFVEKRKPTFTGT